MAQALFFRVLEVSIYYKKIVGNLINFPFTVLA